MISPDQFAAMMAAIRLPGGMPHHLAAAVSGGPDSMAMLWLLSAWAENEGRDILALTVDHGLREGSNDEARSVGAWVSGWPCVTHRVLRWEGDKPASRRMERARDARYALMAQEMKDRGAACLLTAHHRDDLAETFLTRLAKGSGLDGLTAIAPVQPRGDITLVRPLLDVSKEDLVLTCRVNAVLYVDDPTNENDAYLRPRLRAVSDLLGREGLSARRLSVTARRLGRARAALESLAGQLYDAAILETRNDGFLFNAGHLRAAPEELVLRVVLMAMARLRDHADYPARLEKVEALALKLLQDDFSGATLGGCIFANDLRNGTVWIGKER